MKQPRNIQVCGDNIFGRNFPIFGPSVYARFIKIDHTQCGASDSTNFPVLVFLSGNSLKDTAHGGKVASPSGFDIQFWSSVSCSTALVWEIDFYDNINGILWAWVKLPTLSSSVDSTIFVTYGDPTITTLQSVAANVWTNGFVGVWHLSKDSSTVSLVDSTSNANNGTNHSSGAGAGKIAGAGTFNSATPGWVGLTDAAALQPNAVTISAWAKTSDVTHTQVIFRKGTFGYYLRTNPSGFLQAHVFDNAGTDLGVGTNVNNADGNWHLIHGTFDATVSVTNALKGYVDGSNGISTPTANAGVTGAIKYAASSINIGSDVTPPTTTFNGSLDEIRVASLVRSADWILAEFNNQNNPAAFAVDRGEIKIPLRYKSSSSIYRVNTI